MTTLIIMSRFMSQLKL